MSDKHKCLMPNCQELTTTRLCHDHWFKLPIELRKRWWDETSYGKNAPDAALIKAIQDYHANPDNWRPASK